MLHYSAKIARLDMGDFFGQKMATKLPRFFQATSLVFKTYEQSVVQRFMALKSNLQFEPRLKNVFKTTGMDKKNKRDDMSIRKC